MKDNKNLEVSGYIQYVGNSISSDSTEAINKNSKIVINDYIEQLRIQYKGKEYVFDLEKVLSLLCKELENEKNI